MGTCFLRVSEEGPHSSEVGLACQTQFPVKRVLATFIGPSGVWGGSGHFFGDDTDSMWNTGDIPVGNGP